VRNAQILPPARLCRSIRYIPAMPDASTPLFVALREEITQRGPIHFRDYMERALYDPEHGFYGSGRARVGRSGDFFTNVSVGPLFGRLLARQFAEMWAKLGSPADFAIVEQGAHRGDFAADVLGALREFAPACLAAATYWIVEPLEALRTAQHEKLAEWAGVRVRWAESLADLPEFTGVHFSNELPDAFPVHRVVRRAEGWRERAVGFDGVRFVFVDIPLSTDPLKAALVRLPAVPEGYETEINLAGPAWIAEVAARLKRGFILAIDYGYSRSEYYRPERDRGTLSAYAGHQREPDPLARPGEIDLTAHVDFTSLAEAGVAAGLALSGFTDQHHFMVGLGQLHFTGESASPQEIRAFKTLMHPSLMGRSFHALCLARGVDEAELSGFRYGQSAALSFSDANSDAPD
jgi:SAM-dependent MidA family methyltransferase